MEYLFVFVAAWDGRRRRRATLAGRLALAGVLALLLPAARPVEAHPISINSISIISDAGADGEYTAGDVITFEVTFSENIKSWSNNPYIGIQVGNNARSADAEAAPDGGNTDATIAFHYTVGAVDQDTDGITVPASARLRGNITHTDGNSADHTVPSSTTNCPTAWPPAGRTG